MLSSWSGAGRIAGTVHCGGGVYFAFGAADVRDGVGDVRYGAVPQIAGVLWGVSRWWWR